jgi:hypothetical protein
MEALQRLHNRGSISTGFNIDNSAVFDSSAGTAGGTYDYLYYDPSSTSNRRTATLSCWVKRSSDTNTNCVFSAGKNQQHLRYQPGLNWRNYNNSGSINTAGSYRDLSAWYHVMMVLDSGNSTASARNIIYVNGVATERVSSTDATQNDDYNFNYASSRMYIGCRAWYQSTETIIQGFDGYIAELHWIDGAAKSPTDFGEFDEDTGIWKPIKYDGTYGTNGAYLKFENASNLGADSSGNGNNWTPVGLTSASQATDTPTNNFSTLNPLIEQALVPTKYTVTQGGTKQVSAVDGYGCSVGTIGVSKGKWYFEAQFDSDGSGKHFGVIDEASFTTGTAFVDGISPGQQAYGVSIFKNGGINVDGSYVPSYSFSSFTTETLGCAMDLDNNKLYFSRSGTYGNSGDPTSGATGTGAIPLSTAGRGTWFISTACYNGYAQTNQGGYTSYTISSAASDANGYGTFEYAPPSGYYALCTKNLEVYG